MSVLVELSMYPLDAQSTSLSPYVARVINVIKASGITYQLGPMGTTMEGEWKEVMQVIDACYRELDKDCDRIYLNLKADCKRGRENGMGKKVASVMAKTDKA